METAERYADGLADRDELARAEEAAQAVAFAEASARARAGGTCPTSRRRLWRRQASGWTQPSGPRGRQRRRRGRRRRSGGTSAPCSAASSATRSARPRPSPSPSGPTFSSAVRRLAGAIYDGRRFEDLPVLADLLEEAGLTDAGLLGHLRGPGPHGLGGHALDAVLGKK